MSGNNTPLTQRSFDLWKGEHDKRLEVHFKKLTDSIVESKEQRAICQTKVESRFKFTHKIIAIAFAIAMFTGLVMHVPGVQAVVLKVLKFLV